MTTYAAFDARTEAYLRDPGDDDTYRRPIFSILDDDQLDQTDPDHASCPICHTNEGGMRWVPDNGGAWVSSGLWEQVKHDPERYSNATSHWGNLVW